MNPSMISLRPKWPLILMVVAFGAFATVAVSPLRVPVLRAAGWALVANDPVTSADIIVVSSDSGGAGALQAAELVLTRVTVHPSRYSSFDPDGWWETRSGIRTEIVELQKLFS